tara:strand:- start:16199 stop:16507 length:309 start_codon:yes stop_codon:yes gene_type:complete
VSSDFKELLSKLVDIQVEQSSKLDKIAALLLSNQLLIECIDNNGKPRDADTAGEIVSESFSAGLCLLGELENRNKQYLYQMQEFFIDDKQTSIENDDLTNPF